MDEKEFEHIAPQLRQRSIAAARSCGLDADEAEDVAQDTLLKLWTLRRDVDEGCNVEALVAVVARNMAIDRHRRRHTVPMDDRPVTDDRNARPDTLLEIADNERWLSSRMQTLPATEYQVLHLRQVERKTDSEIAAILGIGAGSVPTLLFRARRRLLEAIKKRNQKQA